MVLPAQSHCFRCGRIHGHPWYPSRLLISSSVGGMVSLISDPTTPSRSAVERNGVFRILGHHRRVSVPAAIALALFAVTALADLVQLLIRSRRWRVTDEVHPLSGHRRPHHKPRPADDQIPVQKRCSASAMTRCGYTGTGCLWVTAGNYLRQSATPRAFSRASRFWPYCDAIGWHGAVLDRPPLP